MKAQVGSNKVLPTVLPASVIFSFIEMVLSLVFRVHLMQIAIKDYYVTHLFVDVNEYKSEALI